MFYASRLNNAGGETGVGLEIAIVTAAVLGGNSLGGGRGSVIKALLGTIIVLLVTNSLIRLGFKSGAGSMVLGLILLLAVAIDVRWLKNRLKVLNKTYVAPTYFALPPCPSTQPESGSPYAQNNKLSTAHGIGVGILDGPRTSSSTMRIIFIAAAATATSFASFRPITPDHEIYVHIGGHTLGLAFDKDGNLVVCASGMGVFQSNTPTARCTRYPTKPTEASGRSSTTRACVSLTISTSRRMVGYFSVKRPSATTIRPG